MAFAALVAALLLVSGCGHNSGLVLALDHWELRVEGDESRQAPRAVTLPAHLDGDLPTHGAHYRLHTVVTLPQDLRGRDLVLTVPRLAAAVELTVSGHPVRHDEPHRDDSFRGPAAHAFRIPAPLTDAPLILDLRVRHEWPLDGWIDAVPRLSAEPDGDAAFRRTRSLNQAANFMALGTLWPIAFAHLVIYVFDRRRTQNAWFVLQALTASAYPLFEVGWSERLFGPFDTAFLGWTQASAPMAGLYFTYAAFALGSPPRIFRLLAILVAVVALAAAPFPFLQTFTLAPVVVLTGFTTTIYHLVTLGRLARRRPTPPNVYVLLSAWGVVVCTIVVDGLTFLGGGQGLEGIRTGSWGLIVVALCQSVTLSRLHVASVATADHLNVELKTRVTLLEEQQREIQLLNVELRRQISDRSRQMADLLARTVGGGPPPQLRTGDVVSDRYRIVRLLGSGGMGRVYEVERTTDQRRFALKTLARSVGDLALARLAREAELAAQIVHPNVVGVVDVDVAREGFLYMVVDLVDGSSLEQARPRFGDATWGLPILQQLAQGLAAIHASGVVHRDLKPANVLLATNSGGGTEVKITDFGISSTAPGTGDGDLQDEEETMRLDDPQLTRTGVVLGTPIYMAPELARGARDATPAADVFSLGILAYELLSGRQPFAEPVAVALIRGRPLPPLDAPPIPALSAEAMVVIRKAVALDAAARPSAQEVADALLAQDHHPSARQRSA